MRFRLGWSHMNWPLLYISLEICNIHTIADYLVPKCHHLRDVELVSSLIGPIIWTKFTLMCRSAIDSVSGKNLSPRRTNKCSMTWNNFLAIFKHCTWQRGHYVWIETLTIKFDKIWWLIKFDKIVATCVNWVVGFSARKHAGFYF